MSVYRNTPDGKWRLCGDNRWLRAVAAHCDVAGTAAVHETSALEMGTKRPACYSVTMTHEHNHNSSKNIVVALLLNLGFASAEIVLGLWSNSLAILSNSLHDFGDTFSLGLSWYFDRLSKRERTDTYSYGYRRFSLIPVIVNSTILLIGSGLVAYEAINRILAPQESRTEGMIAFAAIGMVINFIAYVRLRRGASLNEKSASLHLLDDVLSLGAILVVSVVMRFTEVRVLDPILSVAITVFVVVKILRNVRTSGLIFLQGVPRHIDVQSLRDSIAAVDGVQAVHDVHVWSLDGEVDIFTGHVVAGASALRDPDRLRGRVREALRQHHVEHSTIELEGVGGCSGIDCDRPDDGAERRTVDAL